MVVETLLILGLKWFAAHASAPAVTHAATHAGTHVASQIAGDITAGNLTAAAATTGTAYRVGSAVWKARKCKTKKCKGANLTVGDTCPYCRKVKAFDVDAGEWVSQFFNEYASS
jgi:hypothetical protein